MLGARYVRRRTVDTLARISNPMNPEPNGDDQGPIHGIGKTFMTKAAICPRVAGLAGQ